MDEKRMEARIEALEWVIQEALAAALGPATAQNQRRNAVVEAVIASARTTDDLNDEENRSEQPYLLSVDGTAEALGVGRATVYELIRTNELPSVRIGRRRLVPRGLMIEWIRERALGSDASRPSDS